MYRSDINIRHRNKSHLFWGLDKETDEVVYISQVKSRGLDCNCRYNGPLVKTTLEEIIVNTF